MPSTTNSLESSHGHVNRKTPRNNNFYSALYRIISFLIKQNISYKQKIRDNLNYAIRKTLNDGKRISLDEMKRQQRYYETNKEICNFSENKLLSSQLNIDIPCIHRLNLEDLPEIKKGINIQLIMKNQ